MCVCRYKRLVTFCAEYPFIFFKDIVKIYNLNSFYSYDAMLHVGEGSHLGVLFIFGFGDRVLPCSLGAFEFRILLPDSS